MPEYLAPGVYIEEVPSGNKPIEGASTSTAAMVGMTEKGPVDRPTLVTSMGAYDREFGGFLHPELFTEGRDALPYAAEGFFANGGSRLYVTRVVGGGAAESALTLMAEAGGDSDGSIAAQAMAGDSMLLLDATAAPAAGDQLLIRDDSRSETVTVSAPLARIVLQGGIANGYDEDSDIIVQTPDGVARGLTGNHFANDGVIVLDDVSNIGDGNWLRIVDGGNDRSLDEYVSVSGAPSGNDVTLSTPLQRDHADGAVVERLTAGTAVELTRAVSPTTAATTLVVDTTAGLSADDIVQITDGANSDFGIIAAIPSAENRLVLLAGLSRAYNVDDTASPMTPDGTDRGLVGDHVAGAAVITLDVVDDIADGDWLRIIDADGDRSLDEYVSASAPSGNDVTLGTPLQRNHAAGTVVERLIPGAQVELAEPVAASAAPGVLNVDDTSTFVANGVIRLTDGTNSEFGVVASIPHAVPLAAPLSANHATGSRIVATLPALVVHAHSPGRWGDSLQAYTQPAAQLETTLATQATAGSDVINLEIAFGLFPGSIISVDGEQAEVASTDAPSGSVTLTAPLAATHAAGDAVVSQEFTLVVERIANGKVAESEAFEKLSMAPTHPRYAPAIVGRWDQATDTPEITGDSTLVRLSVPDSPAPIAASFVHELPLYLSGGNDDAANVDDTSYIGQASDDPDRRTGIQAMENERTLSIVAVPGRTSVTLQKALIAHCEKMRYRFAVLDTPLTADLAAARAHRQNYDTTRAAVYYPGLVIADRFGPPGALRTIYPSGHMVGVYARTDTTRGVHKAPANEVMRSILTFETKLGKGEQDILNPVHVNCFRDFREENRGLRVYGARVATSDPEFKYINVRRLMLFIEQSLDVGLQWAVFEPNSEPLWAAVKQSVSGFLTTVWRSGALEGIVAEEAFFVNIGYNVTMTQDDIDNGRMIVEIGVAPVKPAEFVIARISQKTREAVA